MTTSATELKGVEKYVWNEVLHSRLATSDAQAYFRHRLDPACQYADKTQTGVEPALASKRVVVGDDKLCIIVSKQQVEEAAKLAPVQAKGHELKSSPTAYLLAAAAPALVSMKPQGGASGLGTVIFKEGKNLGVAYFDVHELSRIGRQTETPHVMLAALKIAVANSREIAVDYDRQRAGKATDRSKASGRGI